MQSHIPIAIQAYAFKKAVTLKQATIPNKGIHGVNGVLKGRWASGCFFLKIKIDKQTAANASKVPNETNLLKTPIGNSPAKTMAITPTIIVDI